MSPVALGLDILLVTLLVTALVVGFRLNRRLSALRDSQAGFAKAVLELDAAATRAEAGLRALKAASEDAHDELLTRIDTARQLANRLEAATAAAATAALVAAEQKPPVAAPLTRAAARLDPRFRDTSVVAPPAAAPRRTPARSIDDDLFESAPEPRAYVGGRR